ncbi:MAG TPA: hypothetical protein VKR82_07295, partial [Candidatus Acidoferrales bacterium]|nr:hypothetical protein [Candidatus Acidoferrales bacterium]
KYRQEENHFDQGRYTAAINGFDGKRSFLAWLADGQECRPANANPGNWSGEPEAFLFGRRDPGDRFLAQGSNSSAQGSGVCFGQARRATLQV